MHGYHVHSDFQRINFTDFMLDSLSIKILSLNFPFMIHFMERMAKYQSLVNCHVMVIFCRLVL